MCQAFNITFILNNSDWTQRMSLSIIFSALLWGKREMKTQKNWELNFSSRMTLKQQKDRDAFEINIIILSI